MKNPLKTLHQKINTGMSGALTRGRDTLKTAPEKIKARIAKLTSPEGKAKILSGSGIALLAGVPVAVGVVLLGPATATVAAGAAALGLLGVGFGLLQEGDNVRYQAAMKKQADVKTQAPKTEAAPIAPTTEAVPSATAPVEEKKVEAAATSKPAVEFTAAAEKKAEEPAVIVAPAAAPAVKVDIAPKP